MKTPAIPAGRSLLPALSAVLAISSFGCTGSPSGPDPCIAAGGQCIFPFESGCAKLGPSNTCNCSGSTCTPGGLYCCLELAAPDAGGD